MAVLFSTLLPLAAQYEFNMNPPKLLRIGAHEHENPTELSLREAFALLQPRLKPPFSFQIPSSSEYTQLNHAIAYGILTEPHLAKTHLTHLHAIVTDGYDLFTSILLKLSSESYPKLLDPSRTQLIWVASKLMDASAIGVDNLFISLLRQIRGGDFSERNLWLSEELLRVSFDKWNWLLDEPLVLTSTLFVYLRLLADHYRLAGDRKLEVLKRMEIDFCIRVLRQHFSLCLSIGRDLIRILQDLVCIPEFRDVWKDLLFNPGTFGVSGYSDILHIYGTSTPLQYFLLRVTFEMEAQIRFLLTCVKWGSQKRYQEWFAKKFLCRPEQETIIIDLIRFICCAHHPPNEIIRSNVISRWAVIGWLLKRCRKNYFVASAKLALFYDWLFFNERVDNVMNIEPAILLMVYSVPEYVEMTHTLMEFLFLLVDNYDIDRKDMIFQGVSMAFSVLVRKGVVHSLEPLTTCSVLSSSLKERLITFLPSSKVEVVREPSTMHSQVVVSREIEPSTCHGKSKLEVVKSLVDGLGATVRQSEKSGLQALENLFISFAELDARALDSEVGESSSTILQPLAFQITEAFKSVGYDMFLPVQSSQNKVDYDDEVQSATAIVLRAYIFYPHERMKEMVLFWSRNGRPVGARFLSYVSRLAYEADTLGGLRNSCIIKENDSGKSLLQHHIDGYISFRYSGGNDSSNVFSSGTVNFKLVVELVEGAFTAYRSFLVSSRMDLPLSNGGIQVEGFSKSMRCEEPRGTNQDQHLSLFHDLLSCCSWNVKISKIFHSVFCHLSDLCTAKEEFIQLLVEQLDHADIVAMQFEISLKRLSIFGKDSGTVCQLVKRSFSWDFVKQKKLWGLLVVDLAVSSIKLEEIVLNLCTSYIDPNLHAVAVEGLFTLVRCCCPTPELIGLVMLLPNTFGDLATAVLASWVSSKKTMFFSSLAEWLAKLNDKRSGLVEPIAVRLNYPAITRLLKFFDEDMKNAEGMSSSPLSIPETVTKLADLIEAEGNR